MWTLRHTYSSSLAGVNKVLHKVSTEFSKDACRVPWKLDGVGLKPEPEPPESLGSSKSTDRLCNFFVCCVVKKIVNSISGCKIFRFIRDAHFLGILEASPWPGETSAGLLCECLPVQQALLFLRFIVHLLELTRRQLDERPFMAFLGKSGFVQKS